MEGVSGALAGASSSGAPTRPGSGVHNSGSHTTLASGGAPNGGAVKATGSSHPGTVAHTKQILASRLSRSHSGAAPLSHGATSSAFSNSSPALGPSSGTHDTGSVLPAQLEDAEHGAQAGSPAQSSRLKPLQVPPGDQEYAATNGAQGAAGAVQAGQEHGVAQEARKGDTQAITAAAGAAGAGHAASTAAQGGAAAAASAQGVAAGASELGGKAASVLPGVSGAVEPAVGTMRPSASGAATAAAVAAARTSSSGGPAAPLPRVSTGQGGLVPARSLNGRAAGAEVGEVAAARMADRAAAEAAALAARQAAARDALRELEKLEHEGAGSDEEAAAGRTQVRFPLVLCNWMVGTAVLLACWSACGAHLRSCQATIHSITSLPSRTPPPQRPPAEQQQQEGEAAGAPPLGRSNSKGQVINKEGSASLKAPPGGPKAGGAAEGQGEADKAQEEWDPNREVAALAQELQGDTAKLTLIDLIGQGAHGSVYRGIWRNLVRGEGGPWEARNASCD